MLWSYAVTLQWDKLRRSGALPHLGRWFELVSTEALLKEVAEKYGPKKPSSRQEFRKELAAAGMGGGGQQPPSLQLQERLSCTILSSMANACGDMHMFLQPPPYS